jgi:hypothetical protein
MEHASEGESYPMRFHILEALSRFDRMGEKLHFKRGEIDYAIQSQLRH